MSRPLTAWCIAVVVLLVAGAASAQSLEDRIKRIKRSQVVPDMQAAGGRAAIQFRLRDIVTPVVIEDVSAKRVFEWWSLTTGIPLVVNWDALEVEGVDPEKLITLHLSNVPAGQLLALIMHSTAPDVTLLYETTPWYVQIMTRNQALRRTVLRIYSIEDLLMTIPSFTNAPVFDLNQALSNTNSGGSSTEGVAEQVTTLIGENPEREIVKPKDEQGEDLAQLIRDTIEPDIWQVNGGQHASVKYFNGRLIVNAPLFVHAQIGVPTTGYTRRTYSASPTSRHHSSRVIRASTAGIVGVDGARNARPPAGIGTR